MSDLDKVKGVFIEESRELLQEVEQGALKLEEHPDRTESLRTIFRHIHSIKGTAGMFGLAHIEQFMHAFEDMLDLLREGELTVTTERVDVILNSVDHARALITDQHEEIPDELQAHTEALTQEIRRLSGHEQSDHTQEEPEVSKSTNIDRWIIELEVTERIEKAARLNPIEQLLTVDGAEFTFVPGKIPTLSGYDPKTIFGSWLIEIPRENAKKSFLETILSQSDAYTYHIDAEPPISQQTSDAATGDETMDAEFAGDDEEEDVFGDFTFEAEPEQASEEKANTTEQEKQITPQKNEKSAEAASTDANASAPTSSPQNGESGQKTIRVRLDVLENLTNRISELVLNRNQLLQLARNEENGQLNKYVNQLDKLTSQIQESAMATRMEPVGNSWTRLPRIVRDLSKKMDKDIDLELKGESTELDRQIMEKLSEPIVHLIRNSIDHGIETAEERRKKGKPETGHITLEAYNSAGNIFIRIEDDGGGLDAERIKEKAITNGLISKREAEELNENQLYDLLFEPGFSTKQEVSKYSGRGVGLDVVKRNIESIGGQIYTESEPGKSTTFTIKIPLTLAVISALTFSAGGRQFAVSEISFFEIVWMNRENIGKLSEVNGRQVLRLRDALIPLVHLNDILELDGERTIEDKYVVIVKSATTTFGLVVDQVDEIQEIVVKPLSRMIQDVSAYSGCTIVGSKQIVLILDIDGISEMAAIEDVEQSIQMEDQSQDLMEEEDDRYLIFRENGSQKAVPLSMVARLEEFRREDLEQVDDDYVIQYRDTVLNLIPFKQATMERLDEIIPTLVLQTQGQQAGLVIEEFLDIVETDLAEADMSAKKGVLAVDVINGKTTEVIDLNWFYQRVNELQVARTLKEQHIGSECVIFEHSSFLRNHLEVVFESFGFESHTADSTKQFHALLESDLEAAVWILGATSYARLDQETQDAFHAAEGLKILVGAQQAEGLDPSPFDTVVDDFDKDEILQAIQTPEPVTE